MLHAFGGCGISEEELSNTFVSCLVADDFLEKYNLISVLFEEVSFVGGCILHERSKQFSGTRRLRIGWLD